MGCYGYADSASQRVLIGAHVKFSDLAIRRMQVDDRLYVTARASRRLTSRKCQSRLCGGKIYVASIDL